MTKVRVVKEISITWIIGAVLAMAATAGSMHLTIYRTIDDVEDNTEAIKKHQKQLMDGVEKFNGVSTDVSLMKTEMEYIKGRAKEDRNMLREILEEVKK